MVIVAGIRWMQLLNEAEQAAVLVLVY